MTTTEPAPTSLQATAVDVRRERLRVLVRRLTGELSPTWPLERFVATNPLLALEETDHELAVIAAARDLGVRAEDDEVTYRRRHDRGEINDHDLISAIAAHEPDAGPARIERLRRELLDAPAVQLPRPSPVLLSEWHDTTRGTTWAAEVDDLASWWCAAYLSDHTAWPMPGRERGLFAAWRALAPHDRRLTRLTPDPTFADVLPDRADDAVLQLLLDLAVDRSDHASYLRRHLVRTTGWTSAIIREHGVDSDDLLGLLAIRLAYELAHFTNGADRATARRAADADPDDGSDEHATALVARRLGIWRDAAERGYRRKLMSLLAPPAQGTDDGAADAGSAPPDVQVVCCIDPRSEGLRRHLEAVGGQTTIGYAGFFGLPVAIADLDAAQPAPSCPVIVAPQVRAAEVEVEPSTRRATGRRRVGAFHQVFAGAKRAPGAPFALAEAAGWAAGPAIALRTLAPGAGARLASAAQARLVPAVPTELRPDAAAWWTLDEQIGIATSILATTGIARRPGRLVLLCGHGSHHVNNLHRAALDCGACGGRAGGNNARLAARLLNDPAVRAGLADRGVADLSETSFVAGEHDTVTDEVRVLDAHTVPDSHVDLLGRLQQDLAVAGERLFAERAASLPGTVGRAAPSRRAARRARGADWAQVVPEWGLAGNAALVVGPRSLSAGSDLGRRVFLHEYDEGADPEGRILAAILGGPLLVAHWINAQYRASVIDPDRLGAGRKPAHNLVGRVGVLEGAGGDLRLGLPTESVSIAGRRVHDPLRLLVVIDASATLLDALLAEAPGVARLVEHGWITLVAHTDDGPDRADSAGWVLRRRGGGWTTDDTLGGTTAGIHTGGRAHAAPDETEAVA